MKPDNKHILTGLTPHSGTMRNHSVHAPASRKPVSLCNSIESTPMNHGIDTAAYIVAAIFFIFSYWERLPS